MSKYFEPGNNMFTSEEVKDHALVYFSLPAFIQAFKKY